MPKVTIPIPIELKVDCRSNCSKCKWGLKPSACEPMNQAMIDAGFTGMKSSEILKFIDNYYGVADKVIPDDEAKDDWGWWLN